MKKLENYLSQKIWINCLKNKENQKFPKPSFQTFKTKLVFALLRQAFIKIQIVKYLNLKY